MNKRLFAGVLVALVFLGICTGGVRLKWKTKPMEEESVRMQVPQLLFTEGEILMADRVLKSEPVREALESVADTELDWARVAGDLDEAWPEWAERATVEIVGQNVVLDFLGQQERLLVQYSVRNGDTVYLITKTYRASPFVGETVYSAAYDCMQGEFEYEQRVSRRQWLPFLKLFG